MPSRRSRPRRLAGAALVALLWLCAARATAAPLDATNRDYEQVHVIVRVTPHIEQGSVDGETTVRFAALADPLRVLRLHCLETTVMGAHDGDGTPLEFSLADGVLAVTLARPCPKGAEAEVTVRYRSRPTAGLYFHAPSKSCPDMPLQMYSQGEGTDNRRWFPCYDEPDARCTCEVYATVAADLQTVSNGSKVGSRPVEGGLREDHWRLDQRVPTYLISLIVGRFETVTETWRDVPLEYNAPLGRGAEIREGCSATKDILEFFSDYTGRKFPYPRYAQTTVWDFVYGGMENAGATTMNMRLLHPPETRPNYTADGLVAHEAAHQWFGDLLTCRTWDHIWLNEGFATYFTDLFFEHRDGPDEFALARFRQNRGYMGGTPHPESLGLTPAPRGDVPLELFGGKQYDRGAAILHQLRLEVGDDAFRAGIRRYVKEDEDRAVTTEDFRHAMEAEAGRDLEWFFDQWVYGAGYPALSVSWTTERLPTGGDVAHVTVDQTQPSGSGQTDVFRITVPYRFVGDGGPGASAKGRLDVRRRHEVFDVVLPVGPAWRFLRVGDGGGTFARIDLRQGLPAWTKALAEDTDPTGRIVAAEALADFPDAAAPVLAAALKADKVPQVRAQAARSLGAMADPAAATALLAAVGDPDARVREAVAEALAGSTRERAGTAVLALAKSDPSPYVRAAAARAAGRLHAEGAFEALRDLLSVDSHREVVRTGALDGLAALGDRRALELAVRLLPYNSCRGDHHGMRQAAMNLLTALAPDDPETHAALRGLLDDPYHRMRTWAAEACGKFGVRSAEARLRQMAESDPDGGAKGAAKAALDRLAGKK